jgi:hypothetical protein
VGTSRIDGPIPTFQFLGLDEEGNALFGDQLPAYNLNIAPHIMTDELEAYRIEPQIPKRVFAGAQTVFLTFAKRGRGHCGAAGDYWTEPN